MKLVISAGDPSGDVRSAELLLELQKLTDVEASGLGGDRLREVGASVDFHLDRYSIMGFGEVIGSLGKMLRLKSMMKEHILSRNPDVLLLVDYPGFNIPLARWACRRGIKVIYYISPQLWAWGRGRVRKIRKYVDLMITMFRFEVDFYREHGVRAVCSGHPFADSIPRPLEPVVSDTVALLPGSRKQEVERLLEPMLESYSILRDRGVASKARIAKASGVPADLYPSSGSIPGVILKNSVRAALETSAAAQVCSGTATLETSMWGVPFLVAYRTSWITFVLARLLVRGVDSIGMANIVAGDKFADELIQGQVNPQKLADCTEPLMKDTEKRRVCLRGSRKVREALGSSGSSQRAAEYVLREIQNGEA
ncbi:MAG: lipid-A-disaccharide synthase [Candidatus Aegiribacteria sp.]|nr:lipid-A-disaccharide synthase [Candidatus Aegiribacteria sp.]MBD3294268.1 lipid-A-disaccharide synthase [Candidatus Fermentibacteria bacterium]